MKEVVFTFVGEFSYAMNWIAPMVHSQFKELDNVKKIVISFAAHEMLYRHFCDEFIAFPTEITDNLYYPATVGEHVNENGQIKDVTPDFVVKYCKKLFPSADIMISPPINAHQMMPCGVYEHLLPINNVKGEVDTFLDGFDKDKTITIMPKFRMRGYSSDEMYYDDQNWDLDNWLDIINNLIRDGFNVVSMYMKSSSGGGGTLSIPIEHPNFREFVIDINSKCALDRQAWLLKLTLCSIYGSTGAHNFPFWVNTPSYAIILERYHHRSFHEWQKKLTDNHKNNKIISVVDFSKCKYSDIYNDIFEYISGLK